MKSALDIHDSSICKVDPLDYVFGLEKLGIKFGLHNINVLCEALDHPERAYRSVIVAGTNGKGSVSAMVERTLRAAGLRTGLYTSPHLVRLEERFAIDGCPVDSNQLREVAAGLPSLVAGLQHQDRLRAQPTFFEVTTAIGFEVFRRAGVDFAVLEVGMGGRFDATSVAPSIAAAITTIDFDHERYLGTTLAQIAFEKAGVIRPGIPVVVGESKPEALQVIEQVCRERGASAVRAFERSRLEVEMVDGRTRMVLDTPARSYGPLLLALRGRHQAANAVVAVRLLEELQALGIPVKEPDIVVGLESTSWPGRLDLRETQGGPVLFDGAHNPAGASALAAYLAEVHPGGLPAVFGAMSDKDAASMLAVLRPHVKHLVVTRPRTARACEPRSLAEMARAAGLEEMEIVETPLAALERARPFGAPVLVAGSIFLVGDLMADLEVLKG